MTRSVLAAVLALAAACAPRDVELSISERGAQRLLASCQPAATGGCTKTSPRPSLQAPTRLQAWLILPDGRFDRGVCADIASLCTETACAVEQLNLALQSSMIDGLRVDGFENQNKALLMVTLHQSGDGAVAPTCGRRDLIGCGIFGTPLSGSDRDITCAACVGGPVAGEGTCLDALEQCPLDDCSQFGCVVEACDELMATTTG